MLWSILKVARAAVIAAMLQTCLLQDMTVQRTIFVRNVIGLSVLGVEDTVTVTCSQKLLEFCGHSGALRAAFMPTHRG